LITSLAKAQAQYLERNSVLARENQYLVGIAQLVLGEKPGDILIAPNLGSCLGISVYDPTTGRGGMVHCLLPLSKSDPIKAANNPCMYVDTGFTMLLDKLLHSGTDKKKLQIIAVGGANINDENNVFEIGKKNVTVLKKLLWKNGLLLKAEDMGDSISRTLLLHIETGKVLLKSKGETRELN
jgi:chemotaxis protein CheD